MFSALPVESSMRGVTKCSSIRPPSVCACRTQRQSYWSDSRPANAVASKSSMTFSCSATLGASSRENETTPLV